MVRIISGAVQQDPNIALMQGMQFGQQYRQAQRQQQDAEREQMGQMIQMQRLKMALDEQKLKRETLLNQQAQMGNAQAIQEMMLQQKMSPGESRAKDAMALVEGIEDPKAKAIAIPALEKLLAIEEDQRKIQAFGAELQRAAQDGLLDPNTEPADPMKPREPGALPSIYDFQSRRQAGESTESLVKELYKSREDRDNKASFAEENLAALEQAKALIQTLPPGDPRRARLAPLVTAYEKAPSLHEEQGSSRRLLTAIHAGLGPPPQRQVSPLNDPKVHRAVFETLRNESSNKTPPTPAQIRERTGQMYGIRTKGRAPTEMPSPELGMSRATHATTRLTNLKVAPQDDDLGKLLSSASDPEDLATKLKSAGIPKTPENAKAIEERFRALAGR